MNLPTTYRRRRTGFLQNDESVGLARARIAAHRSTRPSSTNVLQALGLMLVNVSGFASTCSAAARKRSCSIRAFTSTPRLREKAARKLDDLGDGRTLGLAAMGYPNRPTRSSEPSGSRCGMFPVGPLHRKSPFADVDSHSDNTSREKLPQNGLATPPLAWRPHRRWSLWLVSQVFPSSPPNILSLHHRGEHQRSNGIRWDRPNTEIQLALHEGFVPPPLPTSDTFRSGIDAYSNGSRSLRGARATMPVDSPCRPPVQLGQPT